MKTEKVTINDIEYVMSEIPASRGLKVIFSEEGTIDNMSFVCECTTVDGERLNPDEVNTGTLMRLTPLVLKLNGISVESLEGN